MGILAFFQFGTLTNNTIIKRNNIFKCLKEHKTQNFYPYKKSQFFTQGSSFKILCKQYSSKKRNKSTGNLHAICEVKVSKQHSKDSVI